MKKENANTMAPAKNKMPLRINKVHYDFFHRMGKENIQWWKVENVERAAITIEANVFSKEDIDAVFTYCNQQNLNYSLTSARYSGVIIKIWNK